MFRILFTFLNHEPLSLVSYQFNTIGELEQRLHDPLPLVFQTSAGPVTLNHNDFDVIYVQQPGPTGEFESATVVDVAKRGIVQSYEEIDKTASDAAINESVRTEEGETVGNESEINTIEDVPKPDVATSGYAQVDEFVMVPIETLTTNDQASSTLEWSSTNINEPSTMVIDDLSTKEEIMGDEPEVTAETTTDAKAEDVTVNIGDTTVTAPANEVFVGFCEKFLGSKGRAEGWEVKIIEKQLKYEKDLEETYNVLDARDQMVVGFKESIVGK